MNGVFGRLSIFVPGVLLASLAVCQNLIVFAPDPFIGEFAQSSSSFWLYAGPGTQFERIAAPAVERGKRVRIVAATADRRWYRVRWRETRASEPFAGWAEARHFIVRGRKSEIGEPLRDERREARTQSRAETAPGGAEIEAIRAERERQRAALDRIRTKTEALRQAEEAERARLRAEAEAARRQADEERWRAQTERERVAHAAREVAAQTERHRLERLREAEREQLERRREEEHWQAAQAKRMRAERALLSYALAYSAFFLLPLFPLYRLSIEHRLTHFGQGRHPVLFGGSALGYAGSVWLLSDGRALEFPEAFLILGVLGLFFWYFVPGVLWFSLVFLHSLFVPHPNEALFKRVLRGESLSRAEAEQAARAMYDAKRDGIPADWRVQSQIWRLERLANLMEKEKAFVEKMTENALKSRESRR